MQRYQGQGGEVGWGGLGHGIDWLTVAVARRLAYRRLAGARLQRGVLRAAKYFFSSGARCWVQQCAKTEAAKSLLGWFLVCYMPLACEFHEFRAVACRATSIDLKTLGAGSPFHCHRFAADEIGG